MTVVDRFKEGKAEWVDWKFKFLNAVGTGSKAMRRVLTWVEENRTKGETLTAEKAVEEMQNVHHEDSIAGTFNGIAGMSGEMYSYLVTATTDEALGVVRAVVSGDGIEAWAELHTKYNQRTMTRMMRVLMECMYPKEVKVAELGAAILQWEGKWKKMMDEQPKETHIPELWRMAALMKMCPKEIEKMIEYSWDAMGEKYIVMRDKVMTWVVDKAEEMGGPVSMEVDWLEEQGLEDGEADWWNCEL